MNSVQFSASIMAQSHRIAEVRMEGRAHWARPADEHCFDFLGINVPSTYQQGLIPDGEEPPWGLLRVIVAARELVRFGIQPKGFFVLGFPGETRAQIEDTVRFIGELKDMGVTEAGIFQFKPYPGTEEFALLVAELSYLKRTYADLAGRARESAENHVWLPDGLQIAEVPSGEVRRYIT